MKVDARGQRIAKRSDQPRSSAVDLIMEAKFLVNLLRWLKRSILMSNGVYLRVKEKTARASDSIFKGWKGSPTQVFPRGLNLVEEEG